MDAEMESCTDVLIIGAGPAGLMAGFWLATQGVSITIVERNPTRPLSGRADGFEPRTLEILDSFGLLDTWFRRANQTVELCVWVSDHHRHLERIVRQCNSATGTSRFHESTTDQAVLERTIEDALYQKHDVKVQYDTECLALTRQSRGDKHVRLVAKHKGVTWRHNARFVIGADGASSWTRDQVGIHMQRHLEKHEWGVMDICPLSDFPDIRSRCIIHKENVGTMMIIPRESGMVRLYVQLEQANAALPIVDGPTGTISIAQKILQPFRLNYEICYWASRYRIQQALAAEFTAWNQSVLLIGDAVHTHSPKAGMGLNISLQDAFNLGWKLASVIRRGASAKLLTTYEQERRPVAQFLLDFDRKFCRLFHEPLSGMKMNEYRARLVEASTTEHSELSGTAVQYIDDHLYDNPDYSAIALASGVSIGKRIPEGSVLNQSDGRVWRLHEFLSSTGKWRILVFAGDLRRSTSLSRYNDFGNDLESKLLLCSICEVVTIHQSPRHDINLLDLPAVFHPWNDQHGWDYCKVFADNESCYNKEAGRLYQDLEISPHGCVILLRPDQHICMICKIAGATGLITQYLSNWYPRLVGC